MYMRHVVFKVVQLAVLDCIVSSGQPKDSSGNEKASGFNVKFAHGENFNESYIIQGRI